MINTMNREGTIQQIKDGKPIQIPLLNGVNWNKEHPTSFFIPSDEKKSKLVEGDLVKIVDTYHKERFWVKIEEFISEDLMVGTISNDLIGNQPYNFGDKLFLHMDNIIDVLDEEYERWVNKNHSNLSVENDDNKRNN